MKLSYSLILFAALVASSAHAARPLPPDGHTGQFMALDYPMVQIGKEALRLAPGARVFSEGNRIVMHNQLPAEAKVMYQHDVSGLLLNVWLLSDEEIEALKKAGKKF